MTTSRSDTPPPVRVGCTRAPLKFLFAVKASRFLTHMKKLKDPEEPVLYQLPPGWKLDLGRLEHFLQVLPRGIRHVVEFREPSWYADDVLRLLEAHRVALCLHDMPGSSTGRQRVGRSITSTPT